MKTKAIKSEREINIFRGKIESLVATTAEAKSFLDYVEKLESLVEMASQEDFYGTEGWKHYIGWDD